MATNDCDDADFAEFFELNRVARWISDGGYRRTALQLPDDLLPKAVGLVEELECRLQQQQQSSVGADEEHGKSRHELFVLADTSYKSCCCDEIAAQHAACDSLVHFGDACLSSRCQIPVLYVFCKRPLGLDGFQRQFRSFSSSEASLLSSYKEIFLLCEAGYTHIQDSLEEMISCELPSSSRLHSFRVRKHSDTFNSSDDEQGNSQDFVFLGRAISFEGKKLLDLSDYEDKGEIFLLIFVGHPNSPLLPIFQLTFRHFKTVINFCPEMNRMQIFETATNKALMRRLYLIERLRDAHTVGLVIGSATIAGCREAVARLRAQCAAAGKKLYVLYIGKLNEAKLSNFGLEVNAFVLLSCPFGIMLGAENGKFCCRPLLSCFEAEMALCGERKRRLWTSGGMRWTPNFQQFANDEIDEEVTMKMKDGKIANNREEAEADMSLISGSIRITQSSRDDNEGQMEDNRRQLVKYSAGDYFAARSWRGLEDHTIGCATASANNNGGVREGMDGIAAVYTKEESSKGKNEQNF